MPTKKLYIAHWWDSEHKIFRVAGVYESRGSAWRRIRKLGAGTIQEVPLGQAVRFTHEVRP